MVLGAAIIAGQIVANTAVPEEGGFSVRLSAVRSAARLGHAMMTSEMDTEQVDRAISTIEKS